VDPQLLGAVGVEIERFHGQRLAAAQLALGEGQVAPDRGPQVRQVQSAEHAMPVGVVALGAADGAPRGRRVAALAAQRRQRQHLLVHAVRLGVLHEEVPPMAAAHEGAVGTGHPFLSEVALQCN
jgi:hypothetical protein